MADGRWSGCYKALIGPRFRARGFAAQQTEAAIVVVVLNQMMAAGRPDSVRRMRVTAWRIGVEVIACSVLHVHQRLCDCSVAENFDPWQAGFRDGRIVAHRGMSA